jgi:hypothetical protein
MKKFIDPFRRLWYWLFYGIPDPNKLLGIEPPKIPKCPPHEWTKWKPSLMIQKVTTGIKVEEKPLREHECTVCGQIEYMNLPVPIK